MIVSCLCDLVVGYIWSRGMKGWEELYEEVCISARFGNSLHKEGTLPRPHHLDLGFPVSPP